MRTPTRLQRWENRTEWPLAGMAVVFLVIYSVQVLAQPGGRTGTLLSWALWALYVPFAIDYIARLALADQRIRWFFHHLIDLAVVGLPFLRPLRVLRLLTLMVALQKAFGNATRGRIVAYTATSAAILVYVASLAILNAERANPKANIANFGDALWWAISTVTIGDSGAQYPVTVVGKLIAVLLMIGGISLLGVITATMASWIVQQVSEEETASQIATAAHIDELRAEIQKLVTVTTAYGERLPVE